MIGSNIKVHFAGNDGDEVFHCAQNAADVNYSLYTVYNFIANKKIEDDLTLPDGHVIKDQCKIRKQTIQDSGLFTLMFGAKKDTKQTRESLTDWQDKLVKFVLQNQLSCTVVEIDCQKVLGVEEAWYFRERMRGLLPNRIINVFHYEDGKRGLDRLIEFSDYIALSIPELRIVRGKQHREDTRRLVDYIKCKKPNIDIHLLGCTDIKMLAENRFCTSADSTSWLAGIKYGFIRDGKERSHINHFKKEIFEQRKEKVVEIYKKRGVELTDKRIRYTTNASLCATALKQKYEHVAGSQD